MSIQDLQLNTVQLASPNQLDAVRFPTEIFTDGYNSNPIEFTPDKRFDPASLIPQFQEFADQAKRDFGQFIQIDKNLDTPQLLIVNSAAVLINPVAYQKYIGPRAQFESF